ncbi:MAG: MATE family efflux transporter [Oscillospiraceae bacterium]|nr:MATE family efflux transporter [Oscillospiraceae bacterium]
MKTDLTNQKLSKTIIGFSVPFLLSYFLQTLYGMADLFIIGRFCEKDSTTAVSIGSQVMHMLTVIIVGLAVGCTVNIGKAVGAKKREEASSVIGTSATLFCVISLFLTAFLLLFAKGIVSVMFTPAEAQTGTLSYLRICFIGIPFIVAYNIISSVFRGLGDSKTPMLFVIAACVVNIALDYLFIGRMFLGPIGAAYGTVLSQTFSVCFALIYMRFADIGVKIKLSHLIPKKSIVLSLFKVGLPIALQDGFIQVSFLVITMIANRKSLDTAAAVGVVEKLIGFFFLIPSSMLGAVSAVASQNIGAKKYDRAKQTLKYCAFAAAGFGLFFSVLMQFFAEPAVSVFTKDETVISMGADYLRGYIWDCMFAGIHFCFSGYFSACGKSVLSFVHNIISILTARIPLAYLASVRYESLLPMGFAPTIGSLISVVICLIMYIMLNSRLVGDNEKEI